MKIDRILERYSEDSSRPISWYAGMGKDDLKRAADELVAKVSGVGGDLEWWFPPVKDIPLKPPSPERGASIKEVVEGVGFNYSFVVAKAGRKVRRDFNIALREASRAVTGRELDELPKQEMPPITSEEFGRMMMAVFRRVGPARVFKAMEVVNRRLAELLGDRVVWVCEILKQHGMEDVDERTYFWMSSIFTRVYQAQVALAFGKIIEEVKKWQV